MGLNKYIDHTILKATASSSDVQKLCEEAIEHKIFIVFVLMVVMLQMLNNFLQGN